MYEHNYMGLAIITLGIFLVSLVCPASVERHVLACFSNSRSTSSRKLRGAASLFDTFSLFCEWVTCLIIFSLSSPHSSSSSSSSSCLLCPPLLLLSSFSSETECWVVDRLDTVEELVVVEMFREVEPRLCCGPLDCLCSCNSFSNRLTCDSCCLQQDSAADRVGGIVSTCAYSNIYNALYIIASSLIPRVHSQTIRKGRHRYPDLHVVHSLFEVCAWLL